MLKCKWSHKFIFKNGPLMNFKYLHNQCSCLCKWQVKIKSNSISDYNYMYVTLFTIKRLVLHLKSFIVKWLFNKICIFETILNFWFVPVLWCWFCNQNNCKLNARKQAKKLSWRKYSIFLTLSKKKIISRLKRTFFKEENTCLFFNFVQFVVLL